MSPRGLLALFGFLAIAGGLVVWSTWTPGEGGKSGVVPIPPDPSGAVGARVGAGGAARTWAEKLEASRIGRTRMQVRIPDPEALVDERSCRECHPGETASFARMGHARTLFPPESIGSLEPLIGVPFPDPEEEGVYWSLERRESDGRILMARRSGGTVEERVIDYGVGSASHGITFVSLHPETLAGGSPSGYEHRMTAYVPEGRMRLTPGQGRDKATTGQTPHGREMGSWDTRLCFGCHATATSRRDPDRLDVAEMVPTVRCQRCHGPAGEHVAAARRGETDPARLAMPLGVLSREGELASAFGAGFDHGSDPAAWDARLKAQAADELRTCGDCHRHRENFGIDMLTPDNPDLARFQPVGLQLSRCYRESSVGMRCTTCHDPHRKVSRETSSYERVCMDCHRQEGDSGARAPHPHLTTVAGRHKPCRARPTATSGCVGCHMPKADPGQGFPFANHWILAEPVLPPWDPATIPPLGATAAAPGGE